MEKTFGFSEISSSQIDKYLNSAMLDLVFFHLDYSKYCDFCQNRYFITFFKKDIQI